MGCASERTRLPGSAFEFVLNHREASLISLARTLARCLAARSAEVIARLRMGLGAASDQPAGAAARAVFSSWSIRSWACRKDRRANPGVFGVLGALGRPEPGARA